MKPNTHQSVTNICKLSFEKVSKDFLPETILIKFKSTSYEFFSHTSDWYFLLSSFVQTQDLKAIL